MLKKEQNDLLTQTGPGTPAGEFFRRYWIPALLAEELPEAGCEPVRVQLLSERLLAIRDEDDNLGLIDEFCAHRGVSLWFGRYEDKGQGGGIRCPYHGWKYAADGQCLEVPSEPEDSGFRNRIKLTSYPLVERGGILWTYMGPPEHQPELPEYEFALVPDNQRFVSKRLQESNWLQALEGGIDSSHVSWLHRGDLERDPLIKGAKGNEYNRKDLAPVFDVIDAEAGLYIGVRRNAEDDQYYWRITPWLMPCFTMIPPRGNHPIHGHFWIPIDDEHCWAWSFDYRVYDALTPTEIEQMKNGMSIHARNIPGTYTPVANKSNDYLMDRAAQKAGITFSGVETVGMQDAALQESMGSIQDRSKEHLTSTDNGIVKTRRALLRTILELEEKGIAPPGTSPESQRVRSAAFLAPRDANFFDAARDLLKVRDDQGHATV